MDTLTSVSRLSGVSLTRPPELLIIISRLLPPPVVLRRLPHLGGARACRYRHRRSFSLAVAADAPTHYELLGVGCKAHAREIREAFFRLARVLHPDALAARKASSSDASSAAAAAAAASSLSSSSLRAFARPRARAARFEEVALAYEVLGDPQRRLKYDAALDAASAAKAGAGAATAGAPAAKAGARAPRTRGGSPERSEPEAVFSDMPYEPMSAWRMTWGGENHHYGSRADPWEVHVAGRHRGRHPTAWMSPYRRYRTHNRWW